MTSGLTADNKTRSKTDVTAGSDMGAEKSNKTKPLQNTGDKEQSFLKKEEQLREKEKQLREKELRLEKAYHLAQIGTWEYDMQKEILHWSTITKEVHGFEEDYEPDVESTIELFKEGINRDQFRAAAENAIERGQPFDVELEIISGKGDERWIRAIGEPEFEKGECVRFYGISQNISAHKQAEVELKWSEKRFKALIQDGLDLIAILDREGNYVYVSPTSERVLGIPPRSFIGTNALSYIHDNDRERIASVLSSLSPGEQILIEPFRFINAKGEWRWIETTLTNMLEDPAVAGLVANSRDVTVKIRGEQELEKRQQQLLESLQEKETLLAEIHHRVKNNLAVVSGMMQLQVHEEENDSVTDRLVDSIARIQTMAVIHEQLYEARSFSKLEFSENIRSLVRNIMKTFQSEQKISVDFHCAPLELNINQAIPCSLIVNEVVTNTLKHAFPDRQSGHIKVSLQWEESDNRISLVVADNGIGLPDDFDEIESTSLGLSLIDVLSQQLIAEHTYESNGNRTNYTQE
ncbi:MAG: PAS domain S-box protein, partial [Balneolaceae bacterium]